MEFVQCRGLDGSVELLAFVMFHIRGNFSSDAGDIRSSDGEGTVRFEERMR